MPPQEDFEASVELPDGRMVNVRSNDPEEFSASLDAFITEERKRAQFYDFARHTQLRRSRPFTDEDYALLQTSHQDNHQPAETASLLKPLTRLADHLGSRLMGLTKRAKPV